jgi:hypothetical protein
MGFCPTTSSDGVESLTMPAVVPAQRSLLFLPSILNNGFVRVASIGIPA